MGAGWGGGRAGVTRVGVGAQKERRRVIEDFYSGFNEETVEACRLKQWKATVQGPLRRSNLHILTEKGMKTRHKTATLEDCSGFEEKVRWIRSLSAFFSIIMALNEHQS